MSENNSESSGMNRRELLTYGSGAIAAGFVTRELTTTASASSHAASVDLASPEHPATHNASGLLYGLSYDGTEPSDTWLEPMDIGLQVGGGAQLDDGGWANGGLEGYYNRWNEVAQQYQRVTNPPHDAEYCIRMSDLWGGDGATLADSDPYPGDDGNWGDYYDFLDQILSDIDAEGMGRDEIQYEIWNEPDLDRFWPRSREQYYEMWQRGVDHIRSQHPNARIVGPGHTHYNRSMMEDWLDMTIETGTEPDILNWHVLQEGDDAVRSAADARDLLAEKGLSGMPLEINEYVPAEQENPGYTAWDLARVEKADVEYAALANWTYCCDTPALCATLTEDGTQPNGRWWLYNRYGRTRGDVVTSVESNGIDAAANLNPEGTQSRIIVGNHGLEGEVDITIQNVNQISSSRVRVKVERIPDTEPLEAPLVDQDYAVNVTDSDHTVTLDWSTATDAFVITLSPATPAISDGTYRIEAGHSGKVLDVEESSTDDGANVHQWEDHGGDNQQWYVEHIADSIYRFENVNSGKVLDVDGISEDNGATIHQWEDLGGDNQRWYVEETRSGFYRLEAVHSGKVLDVAGGSTDDGANVQQWVDRSEEQQRWRFLPV